MKSRAVQFQGVCETFLKLGFLRISIAEPPTGQQPIITSDAMSVFLDLFLG